MNKSEDELIEAAIRDARLAVELLTSFQANWGLFVQSCQTHKMDVAEIYGQKCVALVESAVDLFMSSHRRIHLYEKIAQEPHNG